MRNQVPEATLQKLLRHQDTAIASATAIGEWNCNPTGTVRESLRNDWREAILRTTDDEFRLREVLIKDPVLANDWLERRLADQSLSYRDEKTSSVATAVLDVNARKNLLHLVPVTFEMEQLIADLVSGNLDVYRDLLGDERLKPFHLIPLGGYPEGIWIEKAKLALDAGYSVQEVANAAYEYPHFFSWSGNESNVWAQWVERFERLYANEDVRIRQVGEAGKLRAETRLKIALEEERREAIFGRF